MCMYVHVKAGACGGQKGASGAGVASNYEQLSMGAENRT